MAKLTDQLGTDFSTKPVREPPAPSTGLADIFSMAGKAINAVDSSIQQGNADDARKAALARQRAEDDYRDVDRKLPGIIAQGYENADQASRTVFTDPSADTTDPQTQQLNKDFDTAFGRLDSVQAAVTQGRMPKISLMAAINKEYLAQINQFPDHVGAINEEYKKRGIIPSMAQQSVVDQQDSHDNERESIQDVENKAYEAGLKVADPSLVGNMSRDEIIAQGLGAQRGEALRKIAKEELDIKLANTSLDKEAKTAAQEDFDDKMARDTEVDFFNGLNPLREAAQKAMNGMLNLAPGAQREGFTQLGPAINQGIKNQINRMVAQAAEAGYSPEKLDEMRTRLDKSGQGIKDMFQGEFSLRKVEIDAFESVQTRLGLNMAQSFPVWTALKRLGMNAEEITTLAGNVAANPEMAKKLRKEFEGFTGGFGEDRTSTHMINIVKMLRGETNITEYSSTQARQMMKTLHSTSVELSSKYAKGEGISADTMLGGVGNLVSAAATLNASSGLASWQQATIGTTSRTVRQALIKAHKDPQHNDMAEAVIQGSRAASAQILDSMKPHIGSLTGQGWSLVMKDGLLVGKQEKALVNGYSNPTLGMAPTPQLKLLPMPSNVKAFMDTWNTNINNLQLMNEYDPVGGNKKANFRDIAIYYSGSGTPESFQNKEGSINPQFEINKQLKILQDVVNRVPEMNTDVASSIMGVEGMGKDPNSSAQGGFLASTFLDVMKTYHPGSTNGKSDSEILAMRSDPKAIRMATIAYASENSAKLNRLGIPATNGNLNLMHLFGAGEGPKVLKADPSTRIEEVVSKTTLNANEWMKGKTIAQIRKLRRA